MGDAEALFTLHQDADMLRYFDDGHVFVREESRTWLEWHVGMWALEGFSFFAAVRRVDEQFIGWVGLNRVLDDPELDGCAEIGWFIARQHWGEGLATEGARAALGFGFGVLGLDRIIARYRTDNVASGRVMEKIGMRRWKEIPNRQIEGTTITMYEIDLEQYEGAVP
jgi:RimJ/RimL family protein N-acetyltransferase